MEKEKQRFTRAHPASSSARAFRTPGADRPGAFQCRAWSLFFLLLALSSCGGAAGGSGKTITQQQLAGQYTVALTGPEKPALLVEQPLTITLTDTAGQPVDGASIWVGMIMPTMQMSPNEPDAVPAGAGRYHASVLYTMAGSWNLEIHVTIQNREYVTTFHTTTA